MLHFKNGLFLEKFKPYNYTRNTALRTALFYFYTCKNRRTAILKYSMCKLILNFELRLRRITLEDDLLETISGTGRSNSTLQQNILLRYKYTALIYVYFIFNVKFLRNFKDFTYLQLGFFRYGFPSLWFF